MEDTKEQGDHEQANDLFKQTSEKLWTLAFQLHVVI